MMPAEVDTSPGPSPESAGSLVQAECRYLSVVLQTAVASE